MSEIGLQSRSSSSNRSDVDSRRSRFGAHAGTWVLGTLGVCLGLGVAELLVVTGVLPEVDIPRMSTIVGELASQAGQSSFWSSVWLTVKDAGVGLIIAVVLGVPVGVAMGSSEVVHRALRPTVEFLRVVPGLALIPLAQVIWGPNHSSVAFLVAFGCVWIMLVQTMHGILSIEPLSLVTARSFRIGGVERVRSIYLPGSMPYIVTGVRISVAVALIAAIGGELIMGAPGIGTDIYRAQSALNLPEMYALVIASGLIGLLGALIADLLERVLLRWQTAGGGR